MCNIIDINELQLTESGKPNFNLQQEFDKANKKYFNGELTPIPLIYKSMANQIGAVKAMVTRRNRRIIEAEAVHLAINSRYNYTEEQFLSVFLHELCHLSMIQDARSYSWRGGYHGGEWQAIADRISKKSGIPISIDDSTGAYDTANESKPYVVILSRNLKSSFSIAITSLNIWNKKADTWIDEYLGTNDTPWGRGYEFMVFTTVDGRPKNFAAKSVKRPRLYKVDQSIILDILKNNKYEDILYTNS